MAQEEIKLIGSFKDDITPKLKKLNKEISNIGRSFEKFSRHLRPISREFGRIAASAERFNSAMRTQRNALAANARAMGEYKKQAGKMSGAMRAMEAQRARAMRAQGVSRSQQQRGGVGGAIPIPTTPSAGKGTGKAFGTNAGASFKQSIGATAIGTTIGMMASQMIMGAAGKIGNMISMPFKKFGAMFSERASDEMDDIKSAGGLFALDMDLTQESGNERFFKNYNESLRFQEKLNIDMAESAASLPGVTSQYVSTSRQLTDTIQMVMEKNREGFNKMAQGFGANISMGGVEASKEAMRTVLQKQTEQVMLQSQGQQGGLPMHIMIQQLLGKEAKGGKLGIQAFTNRFRAAFQKNPLLKNFLLRAEDELAKTEAGSVERLKLVMETFDAAMPKEVINKMRGSISGMQEALRSGLLDPQAGLFGMSRANLDPKTGQEIMKRNVDDLGNFLYSITDDALKVETKAQVEMLKSLNIDKVIGDSLKGAELTREQMKKLDLGLEVIGDSVKKGNQSVGEVSKSTTYIFEQIREILAGYGPVLLEFVGFLPSLFDPFGEMTNNLKDFRDNAQKFINKFNNNLQQFEDVAVKYSQMADPEKQGLGALLKKQSRSRAAFGTMAKFLESIGGIDAGLSKQIQDIAGATSEAGIKAVDEGALNKMFVPLFNSLINSDLMAEFGKIGGIIIGGITKAVVTMIQGVTNFAKGQGTNKLMQGFIDGFTQAFGDMSFSDAQGIIVDAIVSVVSKGLDLLFTQVIPTLLRMGIQSLFQGLFSGSPVTMILSALGLFKVASFIIGLITPLASVIGFVIANFSLLSGIVGVVSTAILAPILAVAGAVMIVIAIVRNFGSILKMAGGAIKMIVGQLIDAASKYIGALGNIISWIPGLGKIGEGLKNAGEQMKGFGAGLKDQGFNDIKEAGAEMKRQFTEDAAAIKAKFSGMFPSMDATTMSLSQMSGMIDQNVQSIKAEEEARKNARKAVTAFSLQSEDTGSAGTKYTGSTYTAGGIEYDAATGLPVSSITSGAMYQGAGSQPLPAQTSPSPAPPAAAPAAAPALPSAPATPTISMEELKAPMEATKVAVEGVKAPIEATKAAVESVKQPVEETKAAMEALKTELPPAIDTSIKTGVEPAVSGMASLEATVSSAAAQVVAAMSHGQKIEVYATAALPVRMDGMAALLASKGSAKYLGNIRTAASGMNLGSAIATEMRNKPAGSDLVIANSSETIIPAGMRAMAGGGGQISVGNVTVNVSGVDDPKAIANSVAEEILAAIEKSTYSEVFTS